MVPLAPDIVKTIILLFHSFTIFFLFRLLRELYRYFIVDWLSVCVPVCTNKDNNNNNNNNNMLPFLVIYTCAV